MHPVAHGINVSDLQGQAAARAQAHAVHGEIEHFVAQGAGGRKQGLSLLDGDDVRCTLGGLMKLGMAQGLPSTCRV